LVVARDGFLCVTEIVHIFHSGYLDYRGVFQTVLDLYCCEYNTTSASNNTYTHTLILQPQ